MNTLLTVKDVAAILQVSKETVRKYVQQECIPFVKLTNGRMSAVRFHEDSIERWVFSREVNHDGQKLDKANFAVGPAQEQCKTAETVLETTLASEVETTVNSEVVENGAVRNRSRRISIILASYSHHFTPTSTKVYQRIQFPIIGGELCLN